MGRLQCFFFLGGGVVLSSCLFCGLLPLLRLVLFGHFTSWAGDLKLRNPNLENYPYGFEGIEGYWRKGCWRVRAYTVGRGLD